MEGHIKIKSILVLVFALCSGYSQASSNDNILLELEEVKEFIEQQNITLVDARPFIDFERGHIQGAVSLPADETFTKEGRSDLVASLSEMRDLLGGAGIREDSHLVVYGDRNILDTSRLFWVLETYGIKKVSIMNIPFSEWKKRGLPVGKGKEKTKKTEVYPTLNEGKLATMLMVFAAIKNENEGLIDARSEQEFSGHRSMTAVLGHIPSAINIPWDKNLTKDYSRFRPVEELQVLYKSVMKKRMNTVYCNEGKESAVNYVAMRLIGVNARVYDGSWFEWSQRLGLPVIKPHS